MIHGDGREKKSRESEEVKVCSAAPDVTYIFSLRGTTSSQRKKIPKILKKTKRGKKQEKRNKKRTPGKNLLPKIKNEEKKTRRQKLQKARQLSI